MIRGELSVFLLHHLGQSAGTEVTHLSIIKATNEKPIAKKLKMIQTGGEIYFVPGLKESILLKLPYYPRQSIESMKSLSNYQCIFHRSDQLLSRVRLFATPWIAARQASLSITNSQSSPWLTSIESVMPSSHLILYHPFFLLPQSLQHQSLFQWVNSSHEVAKVLEFQL